MGTHQFWPGTEQLVVATNIRRMGAQVSICLQPAQLIVFAISQEMQLVAGRVQQSVLESLQRDLVGTGNRGLKLFGAQCRRRLTLLRKKANLVY